MTATEQRFYWLLLVSSLAGFATTYFPGLWGQPASFWLSELIATLSYFTILSNISIAVLAASQLFYSRTSWALTLSQMKVQTAIAVYITITGLVYNLLLADTWEPQGIDILSDNLLHRVTPLLYVTFWFISVRGKTMNLAHTLPILLFPVAYLIYWLVRGPLVGSYPYFFIDVASYGYAQVLINSVLLWFGFWLVALAYWAINKFTTPIYV
ncbi:MAG: Pr6Pr family membrane protein [Reinekea forsetii]|jgi:hypothetical protein|uniref:Conserved hypothetical membrane protein n=1 Tax=Reinekea forsetii TaxID=1336806 RepID=A0A2K8KM97_9GAMM|nr:Pr6Pr family membrane protein [Reinekea forsetii]ATX75983.1 conserved hypothetical membrane protein [Reinekea forsetii]MDO7642479.1 Pr6Pr family membrane protein [Reinekea forsetii]MDO7643602.1 Pr6Pr family membrane protein [Reinekea forsetii]MDO7673752.1 Pr6Pr family membrane protein [Reinekea forsetii]